jgi:hypothetical protein
MCTLLFLSRYSGNSERAWYYCFLRGFSKEGVVTQVQQTRLASLTEIFSHFLVRLKSIVCGVDTSAFQGQAQDNAATKALGLSARLPVRC